VSSLELQFTNEVPVVAFAVHRSYDQFSDNLQMSRIPVAILCEKIPNED
jgi:hypothetical protein